MADVFDPKAAAPGMNSRAWPEIYPCHHVLQPHRDMVAADGDGTEVTAGCHGYVGLAFDPGMRVDATEALRRFGSSCDPAVVP
ncbi:hypothetical protein ACGFW5_24715 [Streptomyces sp. NPDC048416]|uniref:hypothetical protein n=1 Tax=Streptomyces sp. NPDC048416 TaxID=3365546 RepID=UPI0037187B0A